jgi:hypothetical protein
MFIKNKKLSYEKGKVKMGIRVPRKNSEDV